MVSKILNPFTPPLASWRSGLNPVFVDTALRTKDKALSHVPRLCSYITNNLRILFCIAFCGSNTRYLYSRGPRNHCRYESSGYKLRKEEL